MLKATWNSLSLRSSLVASMALMLLPLLLSAVVGYLVLNRTVIADYQDIAERQRNQIAPLQSLQLAMLQAEIPLEEYLLTGAPERLREYRLLRQDMETGFAQLVPRVAGNTELLSLLERARADWAALEMVVVELLVAHDAQDSQQVASALSRFDIVQGAAHDKLAAAYNLIEDFIEADYLDASRGFERSEWIAGIAAAISLLLLVIGVNLFVRTILDSVERLVDGARRFSEGDRDHRIEVQLPPELHKVAEEFNRMIKVIRKSEENLAEQARHDELTGLLNRTAYEEFIHAAFNRLDRNREKMALIALDVDHFKRVNDTHGHDVGDEVLRSVAKTVMESVRSIDRVFRTGGEEFCILLPGADATAARATAERVRQTVEQHSIAIGGNVLKVTVSLGFALATTALDTPAALKKNADIALYQAKEGGRNIVMPSA